MRLDETKIFLFTFKTDQGDIQFPMRADTAQEAGDKMQKTLQKMQVELAMDFPKTDPKIKEPDHEEVKAILSAPMAIPPEVLELRIDTLLADMGAGTLKGKAKADTIKQWTGHEFTEANYPQIVVELELIRTGQKEVPVKKK